MPLDLQSEPHGPMGNVASEGVRNQLGRPRLHPLAVLVREAAQNCWDARVRPSIRVQFALRRLSEGQRAVLASEVFASQPPNLPFAEVLGASVDLLTVSDRGTSGLGGPTRADVLVGDGAHRDFVDFLRNVGTRPDKALGGGTFGYGKAALYALSRVQTILVYTRCRSDGGLETRLIAACLGASYVEGAGGDARSYTGRHWWGRLVGNLVEPVLDQEADELAARLGLPGFAGQETGTTIAVVGFREFEDVPRSEVCGAIAEALLWNMWPKMLVGDGGLPPIQFSVLLDGTRVPVPDPHDWAPVAAFVEAMEFLKATRDGRRVMPHLKKAEAIKVRRRVVGWLGHAVAVAEGRRPLHRCQDLALGGLPAHEPARHIALMRSAELVVQYLETPPIPTEQFEHAAVFLVVAEKDINDAFANAEPPTHDEWVIENLVDRGQRTIVRTAKRRVRDKVAEWVAPRSPSPRDAAEVPLGALSTQLGALLTGLPGPGAAAPSQGPKRRPKGPRVRRADVDELPFGTQKAPTQEAEEDEQQGRAGANGSVSPEATKGDSAATSATTPPAVKRVGRPKLVANEPRLEVREEQGVLVVPFSVRHGRNSVGTAVKAEVGMELFGEVFETSPPEGAAMPSVVGWLDPEGGLHAAGSDTLMMGPETEGTWALVVQLVDDGTVQARIKADAVEPS